VWGEGPRGARGRGPGSAEPLSPSTDDRPRAARLKNVTATWPLKLEARKPRSVHTNTPPGPCEPFDHTPGHCGCCLPSSSQRKSIGGERPMSRGLRFRSYPRRAGGGLPPPPPLPPSPPPLTWGSALGLPAASCCHCSRGSALWVHALAAFFRAPPSSGFRASVSRRPVPRARVRVHVRVHVQILTERERTREIERSRPARLPSKKETA